MQTMTARRARTPLLALAVVGAALLGACTGVGDSNTAADRSGAGLDEAPSEAATLDLDQVSRPDGRAVIHVADLAIEAGDVEQAAADATTIAEQAGGFVDAQTADLQGAPHVELVLKVPPAEYRAALDAIEDLGDVTSRSESTQDVTKQVIDLDARIASATASTDRLRQLLDGSGTIDDVVTLERELAAREADLESLRATLAGLQGQIDYATITVRIQRPARTASDAEPSDKIPGVLRGLKTGFGAFVNTVLAIVTVVGFALPFLLAAAVITLLTRPFVRKWRARRAERREDSVAVPGPDWPRDHSE